MMETMWAMKSKIFTIFPLIGTLLILPLEEESGVKVRRPVRGQKANKRWRIDSNPYAQSLATTSSSERISGDRLAFFVMCANVAFYTQQH